MTGSTTETPGFRPNSQRAIAGASAWWAALLLGVVAIALRVPQMNESIWYDEYCRTRLYLNAGTVASILTSDVHNPLYNAFMYVWIGVLGDSEWSIRTPSMIAGLVSIVAFSRWASSRFGAVLGWSVAAALAVSPMHVWYSGEAKNTMFCMAGSVLAMIAVDRFREHRSRGCFALSLAACGAALWTDFVAAFVVVPALIAAWYPFGNSGLQDRKRERWSALALCGAVVVLTGPLFVHKAAHVGELWRGYLTPVGLKEVQRLLFGMFLFGDSIFPGDRQRMYLAMTMTVIVGPLLVFGTVRCARRRSGAAVAAAFLVPLPVFSVASLIIQRLTPGPEHYIFQARNAAVMLYPFIAVLCAGVLGLPQRWMRVSGIAALIGAGASGSVLMQTLYHDRVTVMSPNPDWRTVAAEFKEILKESVSPATDVADQRPSGSFTLISKSPVYPLVYYVPGGSVVVVDGGKPWPPHTALTAGPNAGPCFYIDDENWAPLTGDERRQLESAWTMVERVHRGSIHVYTMSPRSSLR